MRLFALCCLLLPVMVQAQPAEGYHLLEDSKEKVVSPDGRFVVEQYERDIPDDQGVIVQEWVFDSTRRHPTLLNPGETGTISFYAAGFRFSRNSEWLVRIQKVAAGESTLFLYHRDGLRFVPATSRQLGDLAWDFYFTQPAAATIGGDLSRETMLVAGMENNYASLGRHWPDSRYIVIDLISGESGTYPLGPWRCVYDTTTGQFSVPSDMKKFNESHAEAQKAAQKDWEKKNH